MKPKRTMRQTLEDNRKGEALWAAMAGKPIRDDLPAVKPKQTRTKDLTIPTESKEQIAFVKWFRTVHKDFRIIAIPNGGNRDMITGSIMKAEGVTRGVPDLYVPAWHLWIEFKRIKGSAISMEQQDWANYLVLSCKHHHFFAYGCADAIDKVNKFLED